MASRLLVLAFASVSLLEAQINPSPLVIAARIAEYYDHIYVSAPGEESDYVLFAGDSLLADVMIINLQPRDADVLWIDDRPILEKLTATLTTAGATRVVPVRPLSVGLAEGPLDAPVDLVDARSIRLRENARVTWRVEVPLSGGPGPVDVSFGVAATDGDSRPIFRMTPTIHIELRVPAANNRVERVRRAATRLVSRGEFDGAVPIINQLRALNVESAEASILLATIALHAGRPEDARQLYATALAQVQQGRDRLLIEHLQPQRMPRYIESLQQKLRTPQ